MESNDESRADNQARAQMRSVAAMVAALQCDYDRLAELREKAREGHWVAGWNMPGYMPDSEPAAFDTCDEARDYLADEMREDAEHLEDKTDSDCLSDACMSGDTSEPDARAAELREVADALADAIGDPDAEFGRTIGARHYWATHAAGLADPDEARELAELTEAADDCSSEDEARERIVEDALSVEVRSGWAGPGETLDPSEFRIVLCTGGPHVELIGDLDKHNEPSRVRCKFADWGTSGELHDFDHDAALAYARCFYFGE